MEKFRCTNSACKHKPILFEGEFIGTVKKKCNSCGIIIEITREKFVRTEKFCKAEKIY